MLNQIIQLYQSFLNLFPSGLHFWISLVIFLVLVFWVLDLVKRSLAWLILLVILVPASIPLLRQIGEGLLRFLRVVVGSF